MKNYLLKPHKRLQICKNKVWIVKGGIQQCWRFIKDKYFLCVHFMYDSKSLVSPLQKTSETLTVEEIYDFIYKSDVCLGILTKRGNASVKSMLKVYKLEKQYSDHINNTQPAANKGDDDDIEVNLDFEEEKGSESDGNLAKQINCPGA